MWVEHGIVPNCGCGNPGNDFEWRQCICGEIVFEPEYGAFGRCGVICPTCENVTRD